MKRYSDESKAEALAVLEANGGNSKRTARDTGIPQTTLRNWREGRGTSAVSSSTRTQKKTELSEKLEEVAWRLTNAITPEMIGKASLVQIMTGLGIVIDKMRLLRGESTSISESRRIDEVRSRLEAKLVGAENGLGDE